MASVWEELKRRNVVKVAIAYIATHDYERAFDEIERAIAEPGQLELSATIELKRNRWDHPALNEPRFVALRGKLGFQD